VHKSLKRFLLVSSCEVYGNTEEPATEDNDVKPRTPYAASKLAQEFVALAAIVHQQLPTVVCRLFNNYGRGQQGNRLIPRIMQALENDQPFELIGDGSQTRDWISLEDTCDALIALLVGADVGVGEIYNITSEEAYSVSQVLAMCEATAKKNILINQSGKDLGHLERSAGTADKLRAATGWRKQRDLQSFIASIF
jgi:nucleoside-diphosphate-sugar epimerase